MTDLHGLTEPLSERQQEILVYLAAGLSNREIASRLYLSLAGVKWNNSEIYSKLGVNNRNDAVERAKELGLLDTESDTPQPTGKHNLPESVTRFVGRTQEINDLMRLLDDDKRLITILAPGGMGKTRLAQEAARIQIGHYADGVYFVPLAPLGSANDIVTTIAENIGFVFHGENPPAQQLVNFLKDRTLLLVLDNFEHLLEGATLVSDIVTSASNITIIVTSRERLNLHEENVYSLRGLDFPTWETPEDALEYDAVTLFMQSAHRVRSDFELHADDLDYLARICRLTEGMPLGIELAAGWVDVLSLEQIATEIQQGIDILETDMRNIPERHRSLRATFDRTWNRLTTNEQSVFARLSVFRGGFTLNAAEGVAGANIRHLRKLAQKSLIQTEGNERYAIHELLRQFGEGKLAEADERTTVQAKHAHYFANFMAERKQDIKTDRQLEALELIDPDFENVRTAWLHLVKEQDWDQLSAFLHSLWFYCDLRSRGQEAVDLLQYAVDALQAAPASAATELALGRVLARLNWAYYDIGFSEKSVACGDEAIRILRQHDSPEDLIAALYNRQFTAQLLNQVEIALDVSLEGLGIARSIDDESWEGYLLIWSGWAIRSAGEYGRVLQFTEQARAVFEKLGDRWGVGYAYIQLARALAGQKRYTQAKPWFEQALAISESFGNASIIALEHVDLAKIGLLERDYAMALNHLTQALQVYWDAGYRWNAVYPLVYIAQAFADRNMAERAVEILATMHPHLTSFHSTDRTAQVLQDGLESRLEPERFTDAWARGEGRNLAALVAEILDTK